MNKIRKTKSIVMRTFLISFAAMMSMVTLMLLMQSLYVNRFYMDRKIDTVIKNLNNFTKSYQEGNWSVSQLSKEINKYNNVNNASVSFNDFSYYENYTEHSDGISDYLIIFELDNHYYDLYVGEQELLAFFDGSIPHKNQSLEMKGLIDNNSYSIIIEEINGKKIDMIAYGYMDNVNEGYNTSQGDIVVQQQSLSREVTIIEVTNVMDTIIGDMKQQDAYDTQVMKETYQMEYNLKEGVYYRIQDTPYSTKEVEFGKWIRGIEDSDILLTAIVSLQPVNEVVTVLRDYAIFFYMIAILISIFIALVYSKLVSRPLITLTHIADRMAKMDFEAKSPIQRQDELGILSNSLNILSGNLDSALGELQEANERLILDMEKEKKQEQVRKEFVANVSHELKTPLGIIKGFAEGIKDGIKKEKSDYYIDVILDEIEKMNGLILDMLELSKIEAGRDKKEEVFSIIDLIEKTAKLLEIPMQEKELHMKIEGEFIAVKGVKFQIDQVVVNLLSNAVKYGNIQSDIIITGKIEDGYNIISIYNEGNTLSEEELESLWLRFYKIDKSHHRQSGGTGLGLAIVRAILEGHGCPYGVENYEKGLLFHFGLQVGEQENVYGIETDSE